MTAPHSGRFGTVDGVTTVLDWSINETQESKEVYASNTKSGPKRTIGVRDWNGSFNFHGNPLMSMMPGEYFNFLGYTAPDDDVEGSTGQRYQGNAICESISIAFNWETQEIIAGTVNFLANGALTPDVGAPYDDIADPILQEACGTKVEWLNGSNWVDYENVISATLNISNDTQAFVNSSTAVGGKCWTFRKKGNMDCDGSLVEQNTLRANFPDVGDDVGFRFYVDNLTYWEILWAKVGEFSGITVNRQTGEIISRTLNFAYNGFNPSAGSIKHPDGSTYWPFT